MIHRMDFLLVGYGQMGKQVERILLQRNHRVAARIDPVGGDVGSMNSELAKKARIAIDFTVPAVAVDNLRRYCEFGLNAVVGTTGWYDRLDECRSMVEDSGIGCLYSANFSLGAQIFFKLVAYATELINPIQDYDILGYEIHHRRKKDSPSGTARALAEIILDRSVRKDTLVVEKLDRQPADNELHIASIRGGEIPGIHRILLDSQADTIELTHSARNRNGFALGAVLGAEWLIGRRGFFEMADFVDEILKGVPESEH